MHYLNWKLAIRNLIQQRRITLLNVIGLSLGFVSVIFISVYVHREFSYNDFHKSADHIYNFKFDIQESETDFDLASNLSLSEIANLREDAPGVEAITFLNFSRWNWDNGASVTYKGKQLELQNMAFTDSYFCDVFSFDIINGNLQECLSTPDGLVLSKKVSDKLFGNENPIGKNVLLNGKIITVKAIIDSEISNSSIVLSGLVNYQSAQYFFGHSIDDWSNVPFLLTKQGVDLAQLNNSFSSSMLKVLSEEDQTRLGIAFNTIFTSINDLYFDTEQSEGLFKYGNKKRSYILLLIGVTILLLAIINFKSLSIACSFKRKKDVAIHKFMGAHINVEHRQAFIQSVIIIMVAFLLAYLILFIVLPSINSLVPFPMAKAELVAHSSFYISLIIVFFVFSILWMLSLNATKKKVELNDSKGGRNMVAWKRLVTFQLFISISLIIGSIIIIKQIQFGLNKDLGIQTKNVLSIPVSKLGVEKVAFIENISNDSRVRSTCLSTSYLNNYSFRGKRLVEANKPSEVVEFTNLLVNETFISTLGITLVGGRNFNAKYLEDNGAYLVNETFVKVYGIENPLESTLDGNNVIGVVNDFNFNSLHAEIEPLAIRNSPQKVGILSILYNEMSAGEQQALIQFLKEEWTALNSDAVFSYELVNDRLKGMYAADIKFAKVVVAFSLLAIIIACLGIFGLLSYLIETRSKEIGIRKVNGAKVMDVVRLINLDLLIWVGIATCFSIPFSLFIMNKWLSQFSYKTNISWWIFVLAACFVLLILILTVSWQSISAARRNPVEALKCE